MTKLHIDWTNELGKQTKFSIDLTPQQIGLGLLVQKSPDLMQALEQLLLLCYQKGFEQRKKK